MGDRGDLSAVSVLRDQIEYSNSEIRIASLYALHQIQDEVEPGLAIGVLDKAKTDQEIQEIENLLLQLEPDVVVPVAAKSLAMVSSKTKPVLIDLLATYRAKDHKTTVMNEWNSDEEAVRVAVYDYLGVVGNETDADLLVERFNDDLSDDELQSLQTALASVLNRSVAETERDQLFRTYYNNGSNLQKARLTSTVPHIDGMNTVDIIETSLRHSSAQVRSAAVEVMGMWNSTEILPLFNLAVSESSGEVSWH